MMHTFSVGAQRYSSQIDPRTGAPVIRSIHPFDHTAYHEARQGAVGSSWFVFRAGRRICTLGKMPEAEVARALLALDARARLIPATA